MAKTQLIKPELISWARERAGLDVDALSRPFPKLAEWESGDAFPTMKQIERLADQFHVPLGYLFLDEPPEESLPIPDYRTIADRRVRITPNLVDTIYDMQRRQDWLREELIESGEQPLDFVGSARGSDVVDLANQMRGALGLDLGWSQEETNWEAAFRALRKAVERLGICVSVTSIVGLNTRRSLDPSDFRGFVLIDEYAPMIFINGADAQSAQMFTFAHELAHVWMGKGGIFDLPSTIAGENAIEKFCNEVAAEFLLPAKLMLKAWPAGGDSLKTVNELSKRFKVSPIVVARRAKDLGFVAPKVFFNFYTKTQEEWRLKKLLQKEQGEGGPDFYKVQNMRLGGRFGLAVVAAARAGRLPYLNAYQLTGMRGDTFDTYGDKLLETFNDARR